MLFGRERPGENVVLRGARVVDPAEGIDATLDVRIDDGVITAAGSRSKSCKAASASCGAAPPAVV